MSLRIRPACTEDVPAITALEHATYTEESYPALFFYQAIAQWPDSFLLATDPHQPTACLGYALCAPANTPNEAWLMSVLTATQSRGQGIGRKLCEAILAQARSNQITTLWLTVEPTNQAAIHLYRGLGFTQIRHITDYLGPGEDRLLMSCSL